MGSRDEQLFRRDNGLSNLGRMREKQFYWRNGRIKNHPSETPFYLAFFAFNWFHHISDDANCGFQILDPDHFDGIRSLIDIVLPK